VIRRLEPAVPFHRDEERDRADENHPMRMVTRQVAFDPDAWTPERAAKVGALFEALAGEWNSRHRVGRQTALVDALARGELPGGRCLEVGSGTGLATVEIAPYFDQVVASDLAFGMLARADRALAPPVQADASRLPFPTDPFDVVAPQNALLFPLEVDRVLRPDGSVLWVNTLGPDTPIYLPADDVAAALPGEWDGVASEAGEGTWCVLHRG
jgi:SAM-dependent methyltransferase